MAVLLLWAALPELSLAQDAGTAMGFSLSVKNPVALAQAGVSLSKGSSSAWSSFSNPASGAFSGKTLDVAAGWTQWGWSDAGMTFLSAGGNALIKGNLGVCAGVSYGLEKEYTNYNSGGLATGSYRPRNLEARVGVSYRILDFLSIGATLGYLGQKLAPDSSYGAFVANVSAMTRFDFGGNSCLKAMFEGGSLGTPVRSAGGNGFRLPSFLRAEAGYCFLAGEKHRLEVLGGCSYYFAGSVSASAGVSYGFDSILFLRGGYCFGGSSPVPSYASAGIGVKFFGVSLDVAYLFASKVLQNSLGVALGYSF